MTVQGPVKKQQPDGMSQGGGGVGLGRPQMVGAGVEKMGSPVQEPILFVVTLR